LHFAPIHSPPPAVPVARGDEDPSISYGKPDPLHTKAVQPNLEWVADHPPIPQGALGERPKLPERIISLFQDTRAGARGLKGFLKKDEGLYLLMNPLAIVNGKVSAFVSSPIAIVSNPPFIAIHPLIIPVWC